MGCCFNYSTKTGRDEIRMIDDRLFVIVDKLGNPLLHFTCAFAFRTLFFASFRSNDAHAQAVVARNLDQSSNTSMCAQWMPPYCATPTNSSMLFSILSTTLKLGIRYCQKHRLRLGRDSIGYSLLSSLLFYPVFF